MKTVSKHIQASTFRIIVSTTMSIDKHWILSVGPKKEFSNKNGLALTYINEDNDSKITLTFDKDFELHSYDGKPSISTDFYNPTSCYANNFEMWHKKGKLHREDGPAGIYTAEEKSYCWALNGTIHSAPAYLRHIEMLDSKEHALMVSLRFGTGSVHSWNLSGDSEYD